MIAFRTQCALQLLSVLLVVGCSSSLQSTSDISLLQGKTVEAKLTTEGFGYDNSLMEQSELGDSLDKVEFVAIDGVITQVGDDVSGRPYFRISDSENPDSGVWVSPLFDFTKDKVVLGSELRIMGYPGIAIDHPDAASIVDDQYFLLAACILDTRATQFHFHQQAEVNCGEWASGEFSGLTAVSKKLQ